ncbi:MAG TPA: SDR family oxidoreductase [Cellvibrionaceae bacterium]
MALTAKTILITGATNGIGLHAASALASLGHTIILHGRNHAKGDVALSFIRQSNPQANVRFLQADFSSLAQVRLLAEHINTLPKLDILINNAGAIFFQREESHDGYEATFATNHLAPFLLTNLILEKLKAAGTARIINVASNAHRRAGALDFSDLMSNKSYAPFKVYCHSKLANVLFTRELAQRLTDTGVTANCLHPGVVRTGFGHNSNIFMRLLLTLAGRLFMISAEQGAKTIVHLATATDIAGCSGQYFVDCKQIAPAAFAQDDLAAKRLWQQSAELTGL